MTKPPRMRWIGLATLASAGLLSGCYYPYGYYNPWGYPYPYPYPAGYPYAAGYPYPPAPEAGVVPQAPQQLAPQQLVPQQPAPGAALQYPQQPVPGAPQPLTEPVQRTPLPPEPVPQ
ncbi:MAG TPA: hypothetical protein VF007_04555 [Stellaceae bacterium]